MVKMHSLRRTAADVAAEKKALGGKGGKNTSTPGDIAAYIPPEDEGAPMEFEHRHLVKMGLHGALKSGDELHFHGHGVVERSETRSSPEGDRHSASVRFHHGAIEHVARDRDETERASIRGDLEKAASGRQIAEKSAGK